MSATFTPAFRAISQLPRLLKGVMPEGVAAFKNLLASAPQQEKSRFIASVQGILQRLATSLEAQEEKNADNHEIFEQLEVLMSKFGPFIQAVEPKLSLDIKEALAMDDANKKVALMKLLVDQTFAAALAVNLKEYLTPSHLNEQEKIDSTLKWAFDSLHIDNGHAAGQAAYDPERAVWRMLFRLLMTFVKTVSAPPLRSMVENKDAQPAQERLIPMKIG